MLIDADNNAILIDYDDVEVTDDIPSTPDDAVERLMSVPEMNTRLSQLKVSRRQYATAIREAFSASRDGHVRL